MLGDWREEVILPDQTKLKNIKVFSTWYPTDHRIPWLMTDHTYYMQAIHENVGYNQPTNVGYYLGSDYSSDSEIWAAAQKADQAIRDYQATSVRSIDNGTLDQRSLATGGTQEWIIDNGVYDLQGRRVSRSVSPLGSSKNSHQLKPGLYIINGKKVVIR